MTLHPLTVSHTSVVCALVPQEGSALEPWELMEVLLDRKERESPAGVRHPSTEWRYIKEYMSSPLVSMQNLQPDGHHNNTRQF